MKTEQQIAAEWASAKHKQLAGEYATQWDRRTARLIRERERDGFETTEAQRAFAAKVERVIAQKI